MACISADEIVCMQNEPIDLYLESLECRLGGERVAGCQCVSASTRCAGSIEGTWDCYLGATMKLHIILLLIQTLFALFLFPLSLITNQY